MQPASPARLYATVAGALLVVVGILGFFYSASFGGPGTVEAALGVLRVNAWLNFLHIATGTVALLLAGLAPRRCALWLGGFYTVLAIWGFAIGGGDAVLGFLPSSGGNDGLHLALGVLGLLAAGGTPKANTARSMWPKPRPLKEIREPQHDALRAGSRGQ